MKRGLEKEINRLFLANEHMHKQNDNLNYQKEICRMVTDGTMDGTDYYMMIYYFVRTMYQNSSVA